MVIKYLKINKTYLYNLTKATGRKWKKQSWYFLIKAIKISGKDYMTTMFEGNYKYCYWGLIWNVNKPPTAGG